MRILIAEDSVLLRDGLTRLLVAEGHDVTGVETAEELLAAIDSGELPDLVITDIRMPPGHSDEGLRAAILLRSLHPRLPIIVLSQYIEQNYAVELFADDAASLAYLLKDRVGRIEEFLEAIDRVVAGGTVIDPEVVAQLMRRTTSSAQGLTPSELEVLRLMAEGRSNSAIAERLHLAIPTVEKRISAIFTKLGLTATTEDHRRVLAVLHYLNANLERN